MKMTDVLLLLALALCCIPDIDAQQDLCRDQAVPVKDCTLECTPICGSDGRTYMNKCFFCNEVLETRGRLRSAHFGNC